MCLSKGSSLTDSLELGLNLSGSIIELLVERIDVGLLDCTGVNMGLSFGLVYPISFFIIKLLFPYPA